MSWNVARCSPLEGLSPISWTLVRPAQHQHSHPTSSSQLLSCCSTGRSGHLPDEAFSDCKNKLHLKLSVWLVYFCYFFPDCSVLSPGEQIAFPQGCLPLCACPSLPVGGAVSFLSCSGLVAAEWTEDQQARHQNGSCRHQPSVSFMFLWCSHTNTACGFFLFVCLFGAKQSE